jgi:hypothetical protein
MQNFGSTSPAQGGFQNLQKNNGAKANNHSGAKADNHNDAKSDNHSGTKADNHNSTKTDITMARRPTSRERVYIPCSRTGFNDGEGVGGTLKRP